MLGILSLCLIFFGFNHLVTGAGIQFCAKNLKNTEPTDEEHLLDVHFAATGAHIMETGTTDMSYSNYKCWSRQINDFDFYHENTDLRVNVIEQDGIWGDDNLGTVYFDAADLLYGTVTVKVSSGGYLQFRLTGQVPTTQTPSTPSTTTTTKTTTHPPPTTTIPTDTSLADSTTHSPAPFVCEAVGKFPDPYKCDIFHECVQDADGSFIDYVMHCPSLTVYCEETEICDTPIKCPCNLEEKKGRDYSI